MRFRLPAIASLAFVAACSGNSDTSGEQVVTEFGDMTATASHSSANELASSLIDRDGTEVASLSWSVGDASIEWQTADTGASLIDADELTPSLEMANEVLHAMWINESGQDIAYDCTCTDYCWREECAYYQQGEYEAYCAYYYWTYDCCNYSCD